MIGLDWIAAGLTLVGVELVTRRRWQGFAVHAVNGILWGYLMWRARLWGLLALEAVFIVQAAVSIYRWTRKEDA